MDEIVTQTSKGFKKKCKNYLIKELRCIPVYITTAKLSVYKVQKSLKEHWTYVKHFRDPVRRNNCLEDLIFLNYLK